MILFFVSLIVFTVLFYIIYFIAPTSYRYLISPIFIPIYVSLCQKYYQNQKDKELAIYKNSINKELEIYKSKLIDRTLVTKLQYELEFEIYKELYSDLVELCLNLENKKEDVVLLKNIFDKKTLKYSPFMEDEIMEHFKKIYFVIEFHINSKSVFTLIEITNDLKTLSNLIKKRITNMKIIE